jgi:lycopene beta-cyclase
MSSAPELANVAIVGAGAAGLSLAVRLAEAGVSDVTVLEAPTASPVTSPPRTWCYWEVGVGEFDDLLTTSWSHVEVIGRDTRPRRLDLAPFRYKMLSSHDFTTAMTARADTAGVQRLTATVQDVWEPSAGGPRIRYVDESGSDHVVTASLVYDTRPVTPVGGSVHLLQHFRGWFVRAPHDTFDVDAAVLMDFRPAQPRRGVAFGYVLPTSPREALIEYTEFSPSRLSDERYDAALHDYVDRVLGLSDLDVVAVEDGAIPMTDAAFPRRLGAHTFRLGAAAGATRPSTGYTFAAAQRQARAVARSLAHGRNPLPPAAFSRRHLAMDRLMLQALDAERISGADFLVDLFDDHPPERVLRFLDGTTTPAEDVAIMRSAPVLPMLRTILPTRAARSASSAV